MTLDRERLWPLYSVDELRDLPQPTWLIEGVLTDGLSVMYGPPGSTKTFLSLAWALSISVGQPWFGRETVAAPVLYVSGEGGGGLANRIESWRIDALSPATNMYLILGTVVLTNREHMIALAQDVKSIGARLMVIDTLARSMAGSDENSAQDMGVVVQALDWLRSETGCASLIVHHCGVERSRPRGSTALFGAADTVVRVTENAGVVDIACEKQKEAQRFATMSARLLSIADSCVLTKRSHVSVGFSPDD